MKMAAITQNKSDIIFLSDTRIITNKGVSSSDRIKNSLRDCSTNRYDAYFNSTANSRGVAILVSKTIPDFSISKEYKDTNENYYVLECKINGILYGIGAIYGPNNTSRTFYNDLTNVIDDLCSRGTVNLILGGDWNTTWDRRPVCDNIDTFHMSGVPNG
jgi:hypothetical protein